MRFAVICAAWALLFVANNPMADSRRAHAAEPTEAVADTAADDEFFEKHVRPVLAERCFKCHGPEKQEGGLRVDSRAALLAGGDTGPAVVPANTAEGYLLDAVRHGDLYQMPPDGKLPADQIAAMERWVERGANWPGSNGQPVIAKHEFNLAERARHWAFQPVAKVKPPSVRQQDWPADDVDRFILAPLEAANIAPSPQADRATWLRRVSYDLIGLPPTPQELADYLQDTSPDAAQRVVHRLLSSPHFGERWARHWLDLVRYAESRGHEFDYEAPNVWQYRDYLIRAFNADVPYRRFVQEHVAGDLLPQPRLNPERGYNESPLGTGFWYLGEWVHSPVDVRKDETERFDNMLDVFSKTFLGLTVGCARCHDHKFDAITQADYYALAGYLQSTAYRQLRFETADQQQSLLEQLDRLKAEQQSLFLPTVYSELTAGAERVPDYLLAAWQVAKNSPGEQWADEDETTQPRPFAPAFQAKIEAAATERGLNADQLGRWVAYLANTTNLRNSPWAGWELPPAPATKPSAAAKPSPVLPRPRGANVVVDFSEAGSSAAWRQDGSSFAYQAPGDLELQPGAPALASVAQRGHVARRAEAPDLRLKAGTQQDPGRISHWNRPGRTFRTGNFTIEPSVVYYLVEGAGRTYAVVDSHRVNQGPLHGAFIKEWETKSGPQWIAHDLRAYAGHRAHLEFTAIDDKPLRLFEVVQSVSPPSASDAVAIAPSPFASSQVAAESPAALERWSQDVRNALTAALAPWKNGQTQPQHPAKDQQQLLALSNWILSHPELLADADAVSRLQTLARKQSDQRQALLAGLPRESATAPVMWEGFPEDEELLIRGNHLTPRGRVPRRFLEAFGSQPAPQTAHSSGRLELAEQLVDPARNPTIARVMVNRVWHHLFGRGLVASTDNFGVLGNEPTHPELLDYLATEFVNDGWSLKRLIARLVLTRAYGMQSGPTAADEVDPQNLLWHRMQLRRLEAETIRDAMLAVSGRLDPTLYGESVPVHLTPFMQGRGRPGQSGPLDGAGRRSIYLAIRRNFLSPMMLAFDQPIPFTSMGRRNVSNVPAQALILMNDPFVIEQAKVWAERLLREPGTTDDRIELLYQQAFARSPSDTEKTAALGFLDQQGTELGLPIAERRNHVRAWADLCHVIFNVKEFVFVP